MENAERPPVWRNVELPLSALEPWEHNPRLIREKQVKRLKSSFQRFGQVDLIAVGPADERGRHPVYNGHQRLSVLLSVHGPSYRVECRVSDRPLTEQERKDLTLFLHKGATGEFDFDALANLYDYDELIAGGFERKELLGLDFSRGDPPEDLGAELDRAEELREKWGVEPGQLWRLGDHLLAVGDCTDPAVVGRLMGDDRAACLWTDPPYGVDYVGKTKDALTIQNDETLGLGSLLAAAFENAGRVMQPGAPWYVAAPPGPQFYEFAGAILAAGWKWRETLVWIKDSMVLGHSDYHYRHEAIFFGYLPGTGRSGRGGAFWYGGNAETSVFEIDRPKRSAEHPTMKPPELVEAHLKNSTLPGDLVLDPFAGSGTTLVACERLSRRARVVEIEPKYAAVSLERWSVLTGCQPGLSGD